MSLNRLNQKQVVGDSGYTFETLQTQLSELENRTRVPAKLAYNTYVQWAGGEEKTNIDFIENLDAITIATGQTSATFVSYIIDTGGFSNVKFNMLEITETSGAENGSTQYETRTADTEEDIATAVWSVVGAGNKIVSANGRYIQFRITMTKATYSPVVTSVAIVLYGAAVTQEVYDARGGYKNLANRLDLMNDMARIEYSAAQGQTTFALPSGYIATGSGLKIFVYLGGALQKYGETNSYTFNENGTSVIFTEGLVESDAVTIIAHKSGTSSTNSSLDDLLATKANLDSPTFTGTVGGITKAMVGLGNVDNTSDLDKPVSNATSTAISTEISARTSMDNTLSAEISTEILNRTSVDNTLSAEISAEISNRTSVDNTISTASSSEIVTRSTAISSEASSRLSADNKLSTDLSTEVITRSTAISTEISARESAITNEISLRTAADSTLTYNLNAEVNNRTNADTTLTTRISTEEITRSTAISTEISTRTSADNKLSTDLANEVTARSTAISSEASSRIAMDNTISSAVSTEVVNRTAAVSGEASTRLSADNKLSTDLAAEASNRISADATMTLQKVYDQSNDGTIKLSATKVFKVLDNNNDIYFQCDPAETNATYVSMTGPVEVSGDMVISGKLTVSGTSTIINSQITDSDHILLSPATGSTTALTIKPDAGVTLTNPIVDLYTTNSGNAVFNINSAGNTTIGGNLTIAASKTINMGGNKVTNVANGTVATDVATYGQLSTQINTEASTRTSVINNLSTSVSTNISTSISTEASTRASAVAAVSSAVSTEVVNRTSAISTEASLRASADTAASTATSTAISTAVSGMKKILSGSGTYVGNKQVETATVKVTTVTTGSINVIVTANGMTGSPITVPVATTAGQTAATVAGNIRTALSGNSNITGFFTVSGTGTSVVLTAKAFAEFDATMNINIQGGYGVNAAPTSVDSITSTTIAFGTTLPNTNYAVSVTTTSLPAVPASIGEVYVVKSTTGITVTNTGSGTATFDYTIAY